MLEDILERYFKAESRGLERSYSELIELLYELNKLGVLERVNETVDFLDEIYNLEF